MQKRIIVMLIILIGVIGFVFGEQKPTYRSYKEALGFQAGGISGTGLSYHRWEGDIGYQVTLGGLYTPIGESSLYYNPNVLDYSIGAEIHYTVYGDDFASWLSGRLYLFNGLHHRGFMAKEWNDPERIYEIGPYTPLFTVGFGIGVEILLFKHFSLPIELGYGVTYNPTQSELSNKFSVDLVPQVGFRYRY